MEQMPASTVEQSANYEGNDGEVLFSRLHEQVIREQIIDLLLKDEEAKIGTLRNYSEYDENDVLVKEEKRPYVPKSREDLEKKYDTWLQGIEESTPVDFTTTDPYEPSTSDVMRPGKLAPWSDKPYTTKQMSILAAHEKGHIIRRYQGEFTRQFFKKGVDLNAMIFSDEEVEKYKKTLSPEDRNKHPDEIRKLFINYLDSAEEIAERMSQLKNYFGMTGSEVFTKEHLDYARTHYLQDTDMDNGMKHFFMSITPEKEEAFLEVINNGGI